MAIDNIVIYVYASGGLIIGYTSTVKTLNAIKKIK